jgi:mannose-1-phosphate guanylyltransferase
MLAGGYGSRLWPISTEKSPKQFGYFYGDGSMILNTYNRLLEIFDKEDIYIVTQTFFFDKIVDQLPDFNTNNLILEPYVRSTSAALAFANIHLRRMYSNDSVLFAFPSDQKISNMYELRNSLEIAESAAIRLNSILTLGIIPTRPETQFGYIQVDSGKFNEYDLYDKGVRYVHSFAEKPDIGTAERFIKAGDFVWNSGIFVVQLNVLEESLKKYLPKHYTAFENLSLYYNKIDFASKLDFTYRSLSPISFDYGVLEKSNNVFCSLSNFDWSDLGTWDEVYRQAIKDTKENFINGEVVAIDTRNSMIIGKDRLIATIGVKDLLIIESDEATLICKRGESPKVKQIIEYLRSRGIKNFL